MRRTGSFVVKLVSIALVGVGAVAVAPSSSSVVGSTPAYAAPTQAGAAVSSFAPLLPGRLLDSRPGSPTVDGEAKGFGPITADSIVDLQVSGRANVPATGVAAVVLNVTAIGESDGGFVTVFPTGSPKPTASNINYEPGQPTANLVVAPVTANGRVSIYMSSKAHLLVDVQGWFSRDPGFESLQPARVLDTRPNSPTIDTVSSGGGAVAGGRFIDVKVTGRGKVPASGAKAVVLNVTAIGESDGGFVSVFPAGSEQPTASNINYQAGQPRANLVVAPVGADGKVSIYVSSKAHVIADVQGWFADDPGFASLQPARLLDTRPNSPTVDGNESGVGALTGGGIIKLQVTARGGVPILGAGAVVLNVTAVGEQDGGFVTVFPSGTDRPTVSNINYPVGQPTANLVVAPVGSGGLVSLYVSSRAHLIVDVQGWLATGSSFNPGTDPTPLPPTPPTNPTTPPTTAGTTTTTAAPGGAADGTITVNASQVRPFSSRMFGTNAASYMGPSTFSDPMVVGRVSNLLGSMRWPGGQHSQYMGWASCELGSNQAIANAAPCIPTDYPQAASAFGDFATAGQFVKLLRSTNTPDAVIGLNMSVTAKENAALASFFNGSIDDTRIIGVDQKNADWKTVGFWAQKRVDSGSPTPLNLNIFEFGNETYGGGSQGGRKGCFPPSPGAAGGWEPTYTCDPAEYLNGLGTGANRFDGYIATRALLKSLFPSIVVGVPIADPIHDKAFNPEVGWNNVYLPYAKGMLSLGKDVIDFLNVHEYLTNKPSQFITDAQIAALPQDHWAGVYNRLTTLMDQNAGRRIPMYQSEYALYPVVANDDLHRTDWVLDGLVMADSIGTMDALGFVGGNQFNMFSESKQDTYYGLVRQDGAYTRSPIYWGTLLWSRFGNRVAQTTSTFDNRTTLSVYGGRTADGKVSLLVINKSTSRKTANINFQGVAGVNRVLTDAATSASLQATSMSFNGNADPASNLSDAPSSDRTFAATSTVLSSFPPGSITLLRFTPTA
jgi:hypothetical protein